MADNKHPKSQRETWEFLKSNPQELEATICVGIACGGSLRQFCTNVGVPFPWVYQHIMGDPAFLRKYEIAMATRKDFMKDFVFDELKQIASDTMRDGLKLKALENLIRFFGLAELDKDDGSGKLTWEAIILMAMKKEGEIRAARAVGPAPSNEGDKNASEAKSPEDSGAREQS